MNFLKTFKASKIPKTVSILYFYQFNLSHLRRLRKSQVEVVAMPEHTQLAGRPNINHNTHSHVLCQPKSKLSKQKKTCLQRPLKKARVKVCQQQPSGKRKIYDYTHSVCNASKQHNQASKEHKKHTRKSESSCIFIVIIHDFCSIGSG